jgi:glycerol-1-phosphatase
MRPVHPYLRGSARPPAEVYDVALLDLDGVVYIGPQAVPQAPDVLAEARRAGMRLAFVTNNAARPPEVVARHLTELGIAASAQEVVTSAQAAAHYLADRLPAGARVLVVGTSGLEEALQERGLVPVADAKGDLDAVVQGYSPDLNWQLLAEGAIAINRGVPWVATNADPTVPSPRGPLPGNGSMVAALRHATGAEPVVTGKPDPTMHRESVQRSHARRPIVVGDRLDTDIEGANAVGCDSLLVLTGVTAAKELLAATPAQRPTFIAADLRGLLTPHEEPTITVDGATCGTWRAVRRDAAPGCVRLELGRHGDPDDDVSTAHSDATADDDMDALRALCAALWGSPDGPPPDNDADSADRGSLHIDPTGEGADATRSAAAIDRLGLT